MKVFTMRRSSGIPAAVDSMLTSSYYERGLDGNLHRHVRIAVQRAKSVDESVVLMNDDEANQLILTLQTELSR